MIILRSSGWAGGDAEQKIALRLVGDLRGACRLWQGSPRNAGISWGPQPRVLADSHPPSALLSMGDAEGGADGSQRPSPGTQRSWVGEGSAARRSHAARLRALGAQPPASPAHVTMKRYCTDKVVQHLQRDKADLIRELWG